MASAAASTLYIGETWHAQGATVGEAMLAARPRAGLLVDAAGRIVAHGDGAVLAAAHTGAKIVDCGDKLIVPGFVDTHVHFPQIDVIGSHGAQLLGWLEKYTYPEEARFADPAYAAAAAERFVTELLSNGTTACAVYGSVHAASAEALFAACERRGIRAVIGKVSMDREAPLALRVPPERDLAETEALIARWHGRDGRLFYALTPRFALSCSDELMAGLGRLASKYDSVYVQTHHAENHDEIAAVARRFPKDRHYLGVYERFGLLGARTILGHSIHATAEERALLSATRCVVAHCPTSNLFLGSGLFPLDAHAADGVRVALATDVGGGTSFSLWRTMSAAYEIQQLRGKSVAAAQLFWLATRGGADALGMSAVSGGFEPGKEADFQVIDWRRSRLLAARLDSPATAAEDRLFALITLADDRLVESVYVRGRMIYGCPPV